jgi:hypothetical protein
MCPRFGRCEENLRKPRFYYKKTKELRIENVSFYTLSPKKENLMNTHITDLSLYRYVETGFKYIKFKRWRQEGSGSIIHNLQLDRYCDPQ